MDSDEDNELLMAVGAWAEQDADSGGDDVVEQTASDAKSKKKKARKDKSKRDSSKEDKETSQDERGDEPSPQPSQQPSFSKPQFTPSTPPKTYSLHLTKIPFDATQSSIRFAFGEKGCHTTSVRLVYDTDQKSGDRHFRGVAFVDLSDEASFNKGLKLHNTPFLGKGKKVNVRPTRTKTELSQIVKRTEEKVADLIAKSKKRKQDEYEKTKSEVGGDDRRNGGKKTKFNRRDKKDDSKSPRSHDNKSPRFHDDKSQRYHDNKSPRSQHSKNNTPNREDGSKTITPHKGKLEGSKKGHDSQKGGDAKSAGKKKDKSPLKLTKKQRAKKAAVLASKGRKKS